LMLNVAAFSAGRSRSLRVHHLWLEAGT
jgi:hypothetical protein